MPRAAPLPAGCKSKPDSAEAHANWANALMDRGQQAEAIVAYRRALEIRPDFAERTPTSATP